MSDKKQCNAAVYKRDTYRVARGTKSGFKMHYDRKQCSRAALDGCEFCRQHQSAADTRYVARFMARPTPGDAA